MTDNRTTERVDHPPRVREAIDELMREKDAIDNRTTELLLDMLYAFLIDYQNILKAAINEEISEKETIARQRAIVREHAERIEQAIAATLGRPTFNANLEQALSFMRIWISDDAHLGESELSAAFEKAEGLRKLDAIENAIAATMWNARAERTCRDASVDSSTQFYCSLCECTVDIPLLWGKVNYCPNCGRKVERGDA